MKVAAAVIVLALLTSPAAAQPQPQPPPPGLPLPPPIPSNPEMLQMFRADGADRQDPKLDWPAVHARDRQRREAARKLLDAGALRTAEDFSHASQVFLHGETAGDYLLAHALATISLKKGNPAGSWLAAEALDRYLMTAGLKQVYGTQFKRTKGGWTQEPYDPQPIPDSVRRELAVRTLPQQADERRWLESRFPPKP